MPVPWEAAFSMLIVIAIFIGMAMNRPPDVLLVGGVVLVTVVGIITPQEAFAGFANTGMLTVAALFVVAAALRETGALDAIGSYLLGGARSERGVLARLAPSVTVMSAFLNNTPIVAMFIPILVAWCKKHQTAPSRLLLPLSYFCILGGTCTLIGTSTNLVVNGLMIEAAEADPELAGPLRPMGLFELGYVGIPYAIIGLIYLFFVGSRLLPSRKDVFETFADASREYLVNLRIQPGCRLVGQTVEGAGLRNLPGLYLVEIQRGDDIIAPVPPEQILHDNDTLTFTGVVTTIVDLEKIPGLVPVADGAYEEEAVRRRGRRLCEAVVSPSAGVVGKTVRAADFRATFGAAVIAVHRGGERLQGKVGDVVLRAGDALLLQTSSHFARAFRNNPSFLLVSGVEDSRPPRSDKAILSLALLGLLIVLMTTGILDIVTSAFVVGGLLIATRCISASDARQSVDYQTLITIAAAFGLSKALVNSGAVALVAEGLVLVTENLGPYALLLGIYILTSIFTETVTNNAAAALVFPFAVAVAGKVDIDPRPLVMAVTFAASASFITPIGYQTNLMVYGPGGYRFVDFVKIGLPLNLILLLCASVLIPLVWPF